MDLVCIFYVEHTETLYLLTLIVNSVKILTNELCVLNCHTRLPFQETSHSHNYIKGKQVGDRSAIYTQLFIHRL